MTNKYKVLSHTFLGSNGDSKYPSYEYKINLNRSTEHTLRLWNGIEKGLDMYEKYETTRNPIKRWFIRWFMDYPKEK